VHAEFWLVEVKDGDCFAYKDLSGRILLKRILKENNAECKLDSSAER
jgi:hypothetical protein